MRSSKATTRLLGLLGVAAFLSWALFVGVRPAGMSSSEGPGPLVEVKVSEHASLAFPTVQAVELNRIEALTASILGKELYRIESTSDSDFTRSLIEAQGLAEMMTGEEAGYLDIPEGVAGPSAGLALTLAAIDKIEKGKFLAGMQIVATGEVSGDGRVLPVGGVAFKAEAVRQSEFYFTVFLVPAGQRKEAVAAESATIVFEVGTVEEAVGAVCALQSNSTVKADVCLDK